MNLEENQTGIGEGFVFLVIAVLLGIVGYKVCGWWVPSVLLGAFTLGTYLNYKVSKIEKKSLK